MPQPCKRKIQGKLHSYAWGASIQILGASSFPPGTEWCIEGSLHGKVNLEFLDVLPNDGTKDMGGELVSDEVYLEPA